MSRLILRVLGTPEVNHAGELLTFQTRKVLALLVYLAVEQGVHSRDKLTALLWPESDEERGKGSLRRTLAYLRDVLKEGSHSHPGEASSQLPHLQVEHDTLRFSPGSDFDLDLHTLQAAFTLARRRSANESAADLQAHLVQWQAALTLYRGNFLDGFSLPDASDFEDWLLLQRETWHRRANTVFDRLSQLQAEGGELENALDTTTRWVTHDPLNEVAHARLIQLHYALGDRAAALQAYENCRTILERELNAEPAPGTMALADSIRAQAPTVHEQVMREPLLPEAALELPLTGRIAEHLALVTAYRTTRRGRTQVVTLEGEPGIGKTRLAKEFLIWAKAQGADVLEGRAFETGGRLPYQPLIEALRSHLERERHPQKPLSDIWLAELTRLLPELRERFPALPPPLMLGEAEARARLFEAVSRLGQSLAEHAPLLLFIDDTQWTDAASLDLLHYASKRWTMANAPLLLLLALRSEDLTTNVALADWLASMERSLVVTRISLASLTFEDTLRLVQFLSGNEGNVVASLADARTSAPLADAGTSIEAFSKQLFAETGGHPFFLIETLKLLAVRGILQLDEVGGWTIDFDATQNYGARRDLLPSGVRELIRTRLIRLGPNALTVCMAGAVLGDGFDFEGVCRVADVSENQGLPALDELLSRGLLRESGGRCFFVHDKIREVAYAEAGEVRRRVFHRRALEALKTMAAPPAEMARHALAAGLQERTFSLSLLAGNEAMRLFAVRDAIGYYERARDLTANSMLAHIAPSDLQQLYSQLGRAYELNSGREKARATYETMLTLARKYSAPQMECAALNHIATQAAQDLGNIEPVQALLRDALAVASASGDKVGLVHTEWNIAQTALYALDRETALSHAERALPLARELDLREFIARSLNQLALIALQWSKSTMAETYAAEATRLYAILGNRAMEVDSMIHLADAQIMAGKPQEGIATVRIALAISLEIENAWGAANSARALALGLIDCGEYSEALEIAQTAVAQARAEGYHPMLVYTLWILGNSYRMLFALDAAYAAHKEAKAIAATFNHPWFTQMVLAGLCADAAVAGDWQEAYSCLQQALAIRDYDMSYVGYTRWYETEALLREGLEERAAEDVRLFGEGAGNTKRYRIPYLRALAVLHQWRGENEQAIRRLQEAAALAEEIGLPGELWPIQAVLGELYQRHGDENQASQAFARAVEIVESLAAKIADEQQRATFLSAQPVQQIFQRTAQN
ncbi:MAG: hypothetical protein NVSMB27_19780 [Ktedonobacteraceae bacterium]